jgi:hypothetical protein
MCQKRPRIRRKRPGIIEGCRRRRLYSAMPEQVWRTRSEASETSMPLYGEEPVQPAPVEP